MKYRHRLTIQYQQITLDAGALPVNAWVDLMTVWADQEDMRGREFVAAAAVGFEDMTRFKMRYKSGIKQGMRATYEGMVYSIIQVSDPDGRKRELRLMCREVSADGS